MHTYTGIMSNEFTRICVNLAGEPQGTAGDQVDRFWGRVGEGARALIRGG